MKEVFLSNEEISLTLKHGRIFTAVHPKTLNRVTNSTAKISVSVPAGSYLTDVIGEDYKSWKPEDDIWLNSACGTGKTTFVMNIIEFFLKQGYKILYLTNRTQLLNQVKCVEKTRSSG